VAVSAAVAVFLATIFSTMAIGAPRPPVYRLILNIPAFEVALFQGEELIRVFPVAVGRPTSPSPTGVLRIVSKIRFPTWMPLDGSPAVPPGPQNPLGSRWMGLSEPHYGLHSTNAPKSIGTAASAGCFRMLPEDAETLFEIVPVGTEVRVIYEPVQARIRDGIVEVRVFKDLYKKGLATAPEALDDLSGSGARFYDDAEGLLASALRRQSGSWTPIGALPGEIAAVDAAGGTASGTPADDRPQSAPGFGGVTINGKDLPRAAVTVLPIDTGGAAEQRDIEITEIMIDAAVACSTAGVEFSAAHGKVFIDTLSVRSTTIGDRAFVTVAEFARATSAGVEIGGAQATIAITISPASAGDR